MRGAASCWSGSRSIRTSSVEPPPISNRMAPRPLRVEQRRAADHGERRLGLAVDHLEPDAGLGRDPARESRRHSSAARQASVAISRSRLGLLRTDLVAADAERGDGAIDRGFADAAGRRDALAQPDDARERIDHAKTVTGRTGDQQPAIVGAEVERGVDAGSDSRATPARRTATADSDPCRASARRMAVAKPRVIVHQNCLSAADAGRRGISVHGNFSSAKRRRNSRIT